jgi:hypothetical protein
MAGTQVKPSADGLRPEKVPKHLPPFDLRIEIGKNRQGKGITVFVHLCHVPGAAESYR